MEAQNRVNDAITVYRAIISKDPFHYPAMNHLGLIYYHQGKYSKAVHEFKMALKIRPNWIETLKHLGETYAKMGKTEKARQIWQKGHQLEPKDTYFVEKLNEKKR